MVGHHENRFQFAISMCSHYMVLVLIADRMTKVKRAREGSFEITIYKKLNVHSHFVQFYSSEDENVN